MTPPRAIYTAAAIELNSQLQVAEVVTIDLRMATAKTSDSDGVQDYPAWSVSGVRLDNLMSCAGTMEVVHNRATRYRVTAAVMWERLGGESPLPDPGTATWEQWLIGPAADVTFYHARRTLKALAGIAGHDLELPKRPYEPVGHGIVSVPYSAFRGQPD